MAATGAVTKPVLYSREIANMHWIWAHKARRLTFSSAAASFAAALSLAPAAQAGSAPERYSSGPAPTALAQLVGATGGNARDATAKRFAYLRKLDSRVQALARDRLEGERLSATDTAGLTVKDGSRVLVDVYVDGDIESAARQLRARGMQVVATSNHEPQRIVEGWLQAGAAPAAAGLASTQAVQAVVGAGTNAGSVMSQGDAVHQGPQARALGPNGAGVKVGVISNTINKTGGGISASQGAGDLPASVQVLNEPASGNDEGRAMAEIIFDMAPGISNMAFSTGLGGAVTKAASIDNLVASGAKVISDDTFLISEPFFQDGLVTKAVDRAHNAGVAYFASAGNRARQSYEANYSPMAGGYHDFDPGAGQDNLQTVVSIPAGEQLSFIAFQWAEPLGHVATDLDLEVWNITSNTLFSTSSSDNIASGIPSEFVPAITNAGGTPITYGIKIKRAAGTAAPKMKYITGGKFGTFNIAEYNTASPTIDPDAAAAAGAIATAAVPSDYPTLNNPENFSSRGPVTHHFDGDGNALPGPEVRQKPDIAGADKVSTTVPGFAPFYGTSAASPHIAGIAALLRQANPTMPVDELYAILRDPSHTVNCQATGLPDASCGYGFELARGAVQQAQDTTPPSIVAVTNPVAPDGSNGWFRQAVTASWSKIDAESPVGISSGCEPKPIEGDGQVTLTCTGTSAGGTTTQSATIKRDGSPPAAPTFTGIVPPKKVATVGVPTRSQIGCKSSDPTSAIAGCSVSGISRRTGKHALLAVAINGAGATTETTRSYRVVVGALTKVTAPGKLRRAAARSGIPVTVSARKRSKVSIAVTADSNGAARKLTLGRLAKTVKKGTTKLRVKLNASGKKKLKKGLKLDLSITGSARGQFTARAHRPVKIN